MKVHVIRVDGTEEDVEIVAPGDLFAVIDNIIGAQSLDHVTLPHRRQIMWVDDIGFAKKLPVNRKATALYHSVCRPGTTQPIVGTVVLTDFEDDE